MLFPRKPSLHALSALCSILALTACGSGSSTKSQNQSNGGQDYSYSIDETINGQHCVYQSPHYANADQYCAALQNTALNTVHGIVCGEDYRHTLYQTDIDCPGEFAPSGNTPPGMHGHFHGSANPGEPTPTATPVMLMGNPPAQVTAAGDEVDYPTPTFRPYVTNCRTNAKFSNQSALNEFKTIQTHFSEAITADTVLNDFPNPQPALGFDPTTSNGIFSVATSSGSANLPNVRLRQQLLQSGRGGISQLSATLDYSANIRNANLSLSDGKLGDANIQTATTDCENLYHSPSSILETLGSSSMRNLSAGCVITYASGNLLRNSPPHVVNLEMQASRSPTDYNLFALASFPDRTDSYDFALRKDLTNNSLALELNVFSSAANLKKGEVSMKINLGDTQTSFADFTIVDTKAGETFFASCKFLPHN
jgi:hypothetical protein